VIIFGLVWFLSKKITKVNLKKQKPKLSQTDRVRFGYFRAKTETQSIGKVFPV
jgi:hypothetical protein